MITLRRATPADMAAILMMGEAMHKESSYLSLSFDFDKVEDTVRVLIGSDQFVMLATDGNKILGGMMGACAAPWFSHEKIVTDMSIYVKPEHRKGRAAFLLVKAYIAWAKERGAKQIRPAVSTGESGKAVEAMYEHFGFKRVGAVFVMEV